MHFIITSILSLISAFWIYMSLYHVDLTMVPFIILGIYFLPTMTAVLFGKSNKLAIFALNLFLGWTGIWWVAALVWSLIGEKE